MVEGSARPGSVVQEAADLTVLVQRKSRRSQLFMGQKLTAQPSQLGLQIHERAAFAVLLKTLDHNRQRDCQQEILFTL